MRMQRNIFWGLLVEGVLQERYQGTHLQRMTINELMDQASEVCIDEREAYLILFTEGFNGYVCRNEGSALESHALYKGTYRNCQIWVERRGITAALRVVKKRIDEVAGLTQGEESLLERLTK
jgi:hypothetical protein